MNLVFYELFQTTEFQYHISGINNDLKRIMGSGILDILEWLDSEIVYQGKTIKLYMVNTPCIHDYFYTELNRYSFLSMQFECDDFKYAKNYSDRIIMINPYYSHLLNESYTIYNFLADLQCDYNGVYSALDTIL